MNALLDEIRTVLAPMLAGLSDDNPPESLKFARQQLAYYLARILQEAPNGDDSPTAA